MLVVVVELLLLLEGLFDKKATLTPSVEASPAWGCFQLVLSFKGVLFTSSTIIIIIIITSWTPSEDVNN